MEPEFIIEGPHPDHDISYKFIEKNDDLQYIEKGITLADFRDNMNKRNLELEFRVVWLESLIYVLAYKKTYRKPVVHPAAQRI
jgi:hypothetical protein